MLVIWGLYVSGTEYFFSYGFFALDGNEQIHQKSAQLSSSEVEFGATSVFSYSDIVSNYYQVSSCFKIDDVFQFHIFQVNSVDTEADLNWFFTFANLLTGELL